MSEAWFHAAHTDSEGWEGPFESKEAAIKDGVATWQDEKLRYFYVATGAPFRAVTCLPGAGDFIEDMEEHAYDNTMADHDILEFKPGGEEALKKLLEAWCAEYVSCSYHQIDGTPERVDVTPDPEPAA